MGYHAAVVQRGAKGNVRAKTEAPRTSSSSSLAVFIERIGDEAGKYDGAAYEQRAARPPQVQRGYMAMSY